MSTESTSRFSIRSIRLPALIMALTAAVVFILFVTRPTLEPVDKPEREWTVDVVEVRHQSMQPELSLFGEVVAGRSSELRPLVDGLIVEIGPNFEEGGLVAKGELLLQIDRFDYETSLSEQQALLKEARARLAKLRRDRDRAQELFAEKNVSEQFLDDAALAVVEQESLVVQREIGVRRAEKDLADTRMVAPFAGVLKDVNGDLGKQFSGFGDNKVADLIDTSRIDVRFSISNAQYGRLLEGVPSLAGRPVRVLWEVGDRKLEYDASIARIGAQITSTTGGIDVYAVIDTGGEQTELRPGAFVSVALPDRQYENVVAVPDSALYGGDRVYVVEDGRLAERRIVIHGYDGSQMLLSSAAEPRLADGDLIVTTQLREGGPGAKVVIR